MQYMVSPANAATTPITKEPPRRPRACQRPCHGSSGLQRPTALLLTRLDRKAMGRPRLWPPMLFWQASCQLRPILAYNIKDIEPIHPEGNINDCTNLHGEVPNGNWPRRSPGGGLNLAPAMPSRPARTPRSDADTAPAFPARSLRAVPATTRTRQLS